MKSNFRNCIMKHFRFIFTIITVILLVTGLNAQEKVIQGVVTTLGNVPLTGIKVEVKSTGQIVRTDTLGRFYVSCDYKDKLIVSADGFYTQKVKIKKPIKFAAVNMVMMPVKRGRAYAVGYDHVLENEKLNAVGNLNENDVNFSVYNDIYELIKGRIPGVLVENGDIIIRGENSINASSTATIIVDGTTVNKNYLSSVRPSDVKNISVIKDGSAAIYGFQGSNGVLIIETKSAKLNHN